MVSGKLKGPGVSGGRKRVIGYFGKRLREVEERLEKLLK